MILTSERSFRYVVVWKGETVLPTHFPPWASSAIDTLQHNAQVDSDNTLVALVRLSNLFSDASEAINERDVQTVQSSRLILIGLDQQYQEVQGSMTPPLMGSGTSSWVNVNMRRRRLHGGKNPYDCKRCLSISSLTAGAYSHSP